MRKAVNAAIIRKGRILLVRKLETWILPGGKPEGKETDIECLTRELGEELPTVQLRNPRFYKQFTGPTPHTEDTIEVSVYLADIKGEPSAGAEINDVGRFRGGNCPQSEITDKIVASLRQDGYL